MPRVPGGRGEGPRGGSTGGSQGQSQECSAVIRYMFPILFLLSFIFLLTFENLKKLEKSVKDNIMLV